MSFRPRASHSSHLPIASILAILVLCAISLSAVPAVSEIHVYWSPNGGCDKAVIELMEKATSTIDGACYTFTLSTIGDELIAARKRGVKVRLIVDHMQSRSQYSQASRLAGAGLFVNQNTHSGLMHHKFIVTDGRNVATGSFNWTDSAVRRNDENLVLFCNEPDIAKQFAARFNAMWNDALRFTPLRAAKPDVRPTAPAVRPTAPAVRPTAPRSSDVTVYVTKTGKKYHRAGCQYLRLSSRPMKRKDAIRAGYGACSVCNP